MNLIDIMLLALLILICAFAVRTCIRNSRSGRGCLGCGCSGNCASCGGCGHPKEGKKKHVGN